MKITHLLILAGLSLTAALTSCEKEHIAPVTRPDQPPVSQPTTPAPTTPPPTTTPPNNTPPNNTPPPVTTSSLLTEMGTRILKYDTQGRLIEVGYSDQMYLGYTIVYEGNKPVRLNYKTGGWVIYRYEGDKVVEATSYYGENLVNYHYDFEYEGDRMVKETTMSYARSDVGQLGISTYKYDANGNLTEISVRWSTSNKPEDLTNPSVITFGAYDSNPNPVPLAYGNYYLPNVKLSTNNPGYRDAGLGKEYYSYEYHESGMPAKRTTTLQAFPYAQPFREQYTYK